MNSVSQQLIWCGGKKRPLSGASTDTKRNRKKAKPQEQQVLEM